MSPPLLALWWLGQRAWLRNQVRRPRRLLFVAVVLALLVVRVVAMPRRPPLLGSDAQSPLLLLGSMLFLLSVASGFLQQGPRFAPADVDFLFPAPLSPRELLLFRLLPRGGPSLERLPPHVRRRRRHAATRLRRARRAR